MLVHYVIVALISFSVSLVGCYLTERWILNRLRKENNEKGE